MQLLLMQESATLFFMRGLLLLNVNCEGHEQSYWSTDVDQGSLHINFSQVTHSLFCAIKF